jgi:DNA-binding transcriptional LysR family regulator
LIVALPPGSVLAEQEGPIRLQALRGQDLVAYPSQPRPSFADQVLALLKDEGAKRGEVQEVWELQTALGLVAAESGVRIIPAGARVQRSDLTYRVIDHEKATSPIILSYRRGAEGVEFVEHGKHIIRDMYAEKPSWLINSYNRDCAP